LIEPPYSSAREILEKALADAGMVVVSSKDQPDIL